jgi:hypothetical protein
MSDELTAVHCDCEGKGERRSNVATAEKKGKQRILSIRRGYLDEQPTRQGKGQPMHVNHLASGQWSREDNKEVKGQPREEGKKKEKTDPLGTAKKREERGRGAS